MQPAPPLPFQEWTFETAPVCCDGVPFNVHSKDGDKEDRKAEALLCHPAVHLKPIVRCRVGTASARAEQQDDFFMWHNIATVERLVVLTCTVMQHRTFVK